MSTGIGALSSSVQKEWELAHSNSIKASSGCLSLSEKVKGVFTAASGNVYEGDLIDGRMTGQGRWKYVSGNTYEGDVVNGKKQGKGIFKFHSDDLTYEGDFSDDLMHGKGRLMSNNQLIYTGDVANNKPHGQGQRFWPNGTSYQGTFDQGILSGKGQITWPDRSCHKGTFDQGVLNGKGEIVWPDGASCQGTFKKGVLCSDASNLGDLPFIELLIGSKLNSTRRLGVHYPLGILSDYLIKNNYSELGSSLKSAHAIYHQANKSGTSPAADVWKQLQDKKPQLLVYGSKTHAVGLNIIPNSFSKSVSFEFFNSGRGLEKFHAKHPSKPGKFQTKLIVEIPEDELKLEKIAKLLQFWQFETIEKSYEEITQIPRAKVILPEEQSVVWHKKQKTKNCIAEWMFAFLRNKMTKYHYDQMRVGLFSKCILEGKERKTIGPEIEAELNRKIKKRNNRMRVRNLAGFEKFLKQVEKVHLFC